MLHVGMDMHKRYSVVTVIDEKGKEVCPASTTPGVALTH
jgi:hypothetical protein